MSEPTSVRRAAPIPRRVGRSLGIYFAVVLAGFASRCDSFPLTWAPMYVAHHSADTYSLTAMDKSELKANGFGITRRNGTRGRVTHEDLNTPFRTFWPLYAERAFGIGPPKHRRAVDDEGAYNTVEVDWPLRLFDTLNRTLGLDPSDPEFIVEIRASRRVIEFADIHSRPRIAGEKILSVILRWTPSGVEVERHESAAPSPRGE